MYVCFLSYRWTSLSVLLFLFAVLVYPCNLILQRILSALFNYSNSYRPVESEHQQRAPGAGRFKGMRPIFNGEKQTKYNRICRLIIHGTVRSEPL